MSDMAVGIKMVLMGKIPILPQRIRGRAEVVRLIDIAAGSNRSLPPTEAK